MKSHLIFIVEEIKDLGASYFRLTLTPKNRPLPSDILPGQFVEIKSPDASVLLRRPISIHDVDYNSSKLYLLIRAVGPGTDSICRLHIGSELDVLLPLGHGFTTDFAPSSKIILVGGGVGVAPLLYLAKELCEKGIRPMMVYGAKNSEEIIIENLLSPYCDLEVTTDDGSMGTSGRVTDSNVFKATLREAAMVQCCGPLPMMKAVAKKCADLAIPCEVSLENMMACGLGACLCCVEPTVKGNVCVCTEGPVFNSKDLLW